VKYKVGDEIDVSLLPCRVCGNRHAKTVTDIDAKGEILRVSWAFNHGKGHALCEVNEREYIQEQRDTINRLLRENRRLNSRLYKAKKKKP